MELDLTAYPQMRVRDREALEVMIAGQTVWLRAPIISIASGSGYAGSVYHADEPGGQWHADGSAIPDATDQDWTMTLGYEGASITYRSGWLVSNAIEMWTPPDASGLVALFDIRQGITQTDSLVSEWASQVAGVSATQPTGAQQPTYAAISQFNAGPGLNFNSMHWLDGIAISVAPASRSVVMGLAFWGGAGGHRGMFGASNAGGYSLIMNGLPNADPIIVAITATMIAAQTDVLFGADVARILSSRITANGGPFAFLYGGVSAGTGTSAGASFSGAGTMRFGRTSGTGEPMQGTISSTLVYDAYLSDEDNARAEGWIAWTTDSANLLANDHPYRNVPPVVV